MKHSDLCVEPMGLVASEMHKFYIFRMPDAREIDLKTSHTSYIVCLSLECNVSSLASWGLNRWWRVCDGLSFLCIEAYLLNFVTYIGTSRKLVPQERPVWLVCCSCFCCACACVSSVFGVCVLCVGVGLKKNKNIRNIRTYRNITKRSKWKWKMAVFYL